MCHLNNGITHIFLEYDVPYQTMVVH